MDMWMDVDTALAEVPVNLLPLLDDTDFKTRETAVAYNAAGMDLVWNFVTTGGALTQTAVTPTTAGTYDWTHQGDGIYTIEIPASGGASINNDTEGFGWFSGVATGVLPWRGPVIGFRAAALNDALIDSAWSTTRGLAGTALPNAAADAAGGLVISDAGGLDADAQRSDVAAILVDTGTTLDGRLPAALVSGRIDASVGAMASGVLTATVIAADAITDAKVASDVTIASVTGAVGSVTGAVGSVTAGVTVTTNNDKTGYALSSAGVQAIWDALTSALTTVGSIGKRIVDYLTGDVYARLGAPAGASVSADVAAVKAETASILTDTAEIGTAGAGLTALASASNLATVAGYIDTEVAAIKAKTDNLPAAPAAVGDIPTAAAVADAVWEEAIADHSGTAGSTAEQLAAAGSSGDPWSTAVPGSYTSGQAGYVLGNVATGTPPTAAAIADAVWDEALSGHAGAGSAGVAVSDILTDTGTTLQGELDGIQADTEDIQSRLPAALVSGRIDASVGAMAANVMTAAAAASDLTTELQSGLATAAALTTVEGKIDTVDTVVDAILVDTAEIGTAGAGLTVLATQTSVDALPTNAELATALGTADDAVLAAIAALNDLSSAGAQSAAAAALTAYGAALQSTLLTGVGYIDTEVAAIKAQTDKLTFDASNRVEANTTAVNDVALTGVGTTGDPWGPA